MLGLIAGSQRTHGFCLAAAFDTADNGSNDIQVPMFEIDTPPLQTEKFALRQPGRCREQNQCALTQCQILNQRLDFSACQHVRSTSAPGTLTNEAYWVAIKQLMPTSMIELDTKDVTDLGS
jgi:hypothetical protein